MTDLSTIRAKVYVTTTEQHVPILTRMEARLLFGRIEALEIMVALYAKRREEAPDEVR